MKYALFVAITISFLITLGSVSAWYGEYQYRKQFTLYNNTDSTALTSAMVRINDNRYNDHVTLYDGIYLTGINISGTNVSNELAVTDLLDNPKKFDVECLTNFDCEIIIVSDRALGQNITGYIYYNLTSQIPDSNLQQIRVFSDEFNGTTFDTTKWNSVGTAQLTLSNGIMKFNYTIGASSQWAVIRTFQKNAYGTYLASVQIVNNDNVIKRIINTYPFSASGSSESGGSGCSSFSAGITQYGLECGATSNLDGTFDTNFNELRIELEPSSQTLKVNNVIKVSLTSTFSQLYDNSSVAQRRDSTAHLNFDYYRFYSNQSLLGYPLLFSNTTFAVETGQQEFFNGTPTSIRLFLNGTEGNRNYTQGETANFTSIINVTGIPISMYSNYTGFIQINNITKIENYTFLNTTGFYTITSNWTGNFTFNPSSQSYSFYVNPINITPTPTTTTTISNVTGGGFTIQTKDFIFGTCLDTNTLGYNRSHSLIQNGQLTTIFEQINKTCSYGCDNQLGICTPNPFYQGLIMLLFFIVLLLLFGLLRYGLKMVFK